jgi:hypothetical protein
LRPNLLEFRLDHAFRHLEIVAFMQLVEQIPLQPSARDISVIGFYPLTQMAFQLVQTFQPHIGREGIVDHGVDIFFDVVDLDLEDGVLAGKVLRPVIFGEGNLHFDIVALLGADELFFKARNEGIRP